MAEKKRKKAASRYPNRADDKYFPDQNLAPSPDEGYRGVPAPMPTPMPAPMPPAPAPMPPAPVRPQGMNKGGAIKKYARGGGIEQRGKTRGKFV